MRRDAIFVLILLGCWVATAQGTSYYVSSSSGSDANPGTQAQPWQTFAGAGNHVNAGTFSAGDVIYLKRGDTWSGDQMIPPSSGAPGLPISFDAYGTGAAPVITEAAPIPFVAGSWIHVSGSVWKASISSALAVATVNMVSFGNLWGRKQAYSGGCTANISNKYDWCISWPYVYVFSPSGTNPTSSYASDGSIVPIVAISAGLQVIAINNKSWLTFQHIKVQNFDYVGVGVAGASDKLVFANMEADGMAAYGTTPPGFYVNASNPASIQFFNDEVRAHDYGWGVANDRNLLGRFNSQTFSLPRLARAQTYSLRLYDNSSPPRYSRYAAALHVDYPL